MTFAIDNSSSWRVGFSSDKFRLIKGNKYSIAYTIDGASPSAITGVARNPGYILVDLPPKSALFDQFRYGTMLAISVNGNVHHFRLDGTSRALSLLLDCATKNYAERETRGEPTRASAPSVKPSSPSSKGVTANDRLDATRFVANLFAGTDFRDYRLMTSDELNDKETPDVLRSSDVAWISPNAVGALHIFSTATTPIDDQISAAMASDAKSCKGRFASGKLPDEEKTNFKQLFTVCEDKDNNFRVEYLFLPRKNGLAYRFGILSLGKSEKTPDNKTLRDALKGVAL